MATVPKQQAARSRASGSRAGRRRATEDGAPKDGAPKDRATEGGAAGAAAGEAPYGDEQPGEPGRARSTTGDLLNLVEQLSNFDRIGVTRLARHLGVPVPTAYRMLRALERAGYVEQLAESKEYRLTLKLFELGSRVASRTTLRDLAAVEVERLAQQSGLASNVSVLVDGDVLYLAQVKTEELLAVNLTPGSRAPATCTAMGKAMLAVEYRDVRAVVGSGPYPRRTEHSITTYEELATELAAVQRAGYAVDRQELNLGVWCVAAPILGVRQTQPAAVSVSAYRPQLDAAEEERLGKLVIAAASRIADRLGGLGNMVSW
jgi:DNA-binding IclR family transcriptional regulator